MDWRGVCLVLAAINLSCRPADSCHGSIQAGNAGVRDRMQTCAGARLRSGRFGIPACWNRANVAAALLCMALAFAGGSFLMSAVHTSFFLILDQMGRAAALAALAGAVIGPMQVAASVIEMLTGERVSASLVGLISSAALLLGIRDPGCRRCGLMEMP
jgi:hypothetical protein